MQQRTRRLLFIGLGLGIGVSSLAVAGCGRDSDRTAQPAISAPAPVTPPAGPAQAAGAAPAADGSVSGTVVETMDSGGYTYAKLDDGTTQVWVAGPATPLTVGTRIGKLSGTPMPGFHSSTLQRTFDQLYFVTAFPVTGDAGPNPHGAVPGGAGPNPHGAVPAAVAVEKIARAPGGKTVAEVYAGKDALAGKEVAVRGKVVKVNANILGRTWVHLQDGTGGAGTNDLMVTTAASPATGDVVVVRGKLATNKEFGAGYKYDVIVEDATLSAK